MDALGAVVTFVLRGALSLALLAFLVFLLWIPVSVVVGIVRMVRGRPEPSGSRWRRLLLDPAGTLGNRLDASLGAAERLVRARRKRRVRLAGFENWPRIYRAGGRAGRGPANPAGSPLRLARLDEGREGLGGRCGRGVRVLAGGPADIWVYQNTGGMIEAAICGFVSFYVFHALFRRILWRFSMSPLRMTFWNGGIEWKGAAQARKRFGFGGADVVKRGEKWNPEVRPHRLAAQELRDNEERRQRRLKPKPMYYQQCSEVLIFAGPGLPRTLTVAEMAEDEQGDKARALVAAIIAACGLSIGAGPELGLVELGGAADTVEEPAAVPVPGARRRGLRR